MPLPSLITATPNPCQAGGKLRICYDFSNPATQSPVTLTLDYDPDPDQEVEVSRANPCVDVDTPTDAKDLLIVDGSGQSSSKGVVFT